MSAPVNSRPAKVDRQRRQPTAISRKTAISVMIIPSSMSLWATSGATRPSPATIIPTCVSSPVALPSRVWNAGALAKACCFSTAFS
jgi:hypothetical protein